MNSFDGEHLTKEADDRAKRKRELLLQDQDEWSVTNSQKAWLDMGFR